MSSTNLKLGLPSPRVADQELQIFLDRVAGALRTWNGESATPLDRVPTLGELVTLGVLDSDDPRTGEATLPRLVQTTTGDATITVAAGTWTDVPSAQLELPAVRSREFQQRTVLVMFSTESNYVLADSTTQGGVRFLRDDTEIAAFYPFFVATGSADHTSVSNFLCTVDLISDPTKHLYKVQARRGSSDPFTVGTDIRLVNWRFTIFEVR